MDSFVPKITKIYPLNPAKKEACKAFIDEHLKMGWIVPSKSPQAAPFSFVLKKDGTLCPCQDYHYLNSHTIHNRYPLPLIPELIDNMKDSTLLPNSMSDGDTITFAFKKRINGRLHSSLPSVSSNLLSCFFWFCNTPPTFQMFMNHIFADMIAEKWLKIYMDNLGIHTMDDLELHH